MTSTFITYSETTLTFPKEKEHVNQLNQKTYNANTTTSKFLWRENISLVQAIVLIIMLINVVLINVMLYILMVLAITITT